MFSWGRWVNSKTLKERREEKQFKKQLKKHKETCAKNRKARKKKKS